MIPSLSALSEERKEAAPFEHGVREVVQCVCDRCHRWQLDSVVAKARGRVKVRGLLVEGVPADAIVRTAKARGARMIVMGTHGRRGAARFFLGSVASRVVAAAHCPVLTVRGR